MYFFGEIPLDKSHHKNHYCLAMLNSMAFPTASIIPMTAGRAATLTVRHGSSWWLISKQAKYPPSLLRT